MSRVVRLIPHEESFEVRGFPMPPQPAVISCDGRLVFGPPRFVREPPIEFSTFPNLDSSLACRRSDA